MDRGAWQAIVHGVAKSCQTWHNWVTNTTTTTYYRIWWAWNLGFHLCDWQKALCLGSIMCSPPHTRLGSRHSYRRQPHRRELSVHPRRQKPASQLEYAPKLLTQCSSFHPSFQKHPYYHNHHSDTGLHLPVQTWIQMLQVSKTSQKQSQELFYMLNLVSSSEDFKPHKDAKPSGSDRRL